MKMLRKLDSYVDIMRTILLTFVLIGHTVIGQNEIDPVGPGVCNHIISRTDTVVTSAMQSRIVPYNGECSWQRHIPGCLVYKVTFQPVYKTTTRLHHIPDYKCCHGWSRVGQKCEKDPTTVPEPPQGPLTPALDIPRYPFKPGLGGRGQRNKPGISQRGFGPGAFVPRPGFGPPKPTGRPGVGRGPGRGQGNGPQFDPRPGFGAGTNQNPGGGPGRGFGPRTETGFGGRGPNVGTEPRYGVPGTQNPNYPGGPPQFTQRPQYPQHPQRPQRPQGPQFGRPPFTPRTPGYDSNFGGNGGGRGNGGGMGNGGGRGNGVGRGNGGGRGQSNNAGSGNGVKPDVNPGRSPDQTSGQGPTGGDKTGNEHLNKENTGGGSIVTIMGALLGVFAIFGIGAVLMMYLSRRRDSAGRRSVRLRRNSLRDAAGRDSEAHKSWKFSIYQFRLQ